MKSKGMWLTAAGCLGTIVMLGQTPPAPRQGPGVQAPQDARYPDFIASKCKTPPQRGGGAGGGAGRGSGSGAGSGAGRGAGSAAARGGAPAGPVEYSVKEIPGVIAAGQKWKSVWTGTGNNADGILATKDGGILAAQNTNSTVMKLDKDGKVSTPYMNTNTGGALSMNRKGALFIVERGLQMGVFQLEPKRPSEAFANMFNGEPLECTGGLVNDLTADSKGGVYFTMTGLYYANPKGVVTKQGTITGTNGIILSRDEKILYVTGRIASSPAAAGRGATPTPGTGGSLIAYDVQPDGSLTNERQFASVGNDGTTLDSEGRLYTTGGGGIQVVSPDGKWLGEIPSPRPLITAAFSGPKKKTLYAVFNNQQQDEIFTIEMIAQGFKGRAK